MPCYQFKTSDGGKGFMCGYLGPHCACCADAGDFALCDFPVGEGKTCDRPLCEEHAHEVAPDLHYCDSHFAEWTKFRDAGGVQRELANVVPFKRPNARLSGAGTASA